MNSDEKLQLQKMIDANSVDNNTELIRNLKHSSDIRGDIQTMIILKKKYNHMEDTLEKQAIFEHECPFLYKNYKYLYEKLYKDQLELPILQRMLSILAKIETKEMDQHLASFEVGKLLKEIYIDSTIYTNTASKEISWAEYKKMTN